MNAIDRQPVASAALQFLADSGGPVAIHAGHFMLVPQGDTCRPTVVAYPGGDLSGSNGNPLNDALSHFTLETWRMGVALAAHLRLQNRKTELLTLVNDWQYLRRSPNAHALRRQFYDSNHKPFDSFDRILKDFHLDTSAIMTLGQWHPFISESRLRRRIERRLKRLMAADDGLAAELAVEHHVDGQQYLVFDDFGRACRLLVCGQSDCAGEVMELICMLYEQGYRRLINFIPKECEIPVNEGSRRAIAVFRHDDFAALNIALPCLGSTWSASGAPTSSISRVFGDRVESGGVDAIVESFLSDAR